MTVMAGPARCALTLPMRLLPPVALVALLLSACSQEKKAGAALAQGAVAVASGTAETRDVPIALRAVGRVEARRSVSVRARVGGQLIRVGFAEGSDVRQGDLLFQVDPRPYRAALDEAEAVLARDAARAATAAAEARRFAELVQKDLVTHQESEDKAAAAERRH